MHLQVGGQVQVQACYAYEAQWRRPLPLQWLSGLWTGGCAPRSTLHSQWGVGHPPLVHASRILLWALRTPPEGGVPKNFPGASAPPEGGAAEIFLGATDPPWEAGISRNFFGATDPPEGGVPENFSGASGPP